MTPTQTPPKPDGYIAENALAAAWRIKPGILRRLLQRAGIHPRTVQHTLSGLPGVPEGATITRRYYPAHLHPAATCKPSN